MSENVAKFPGAKILVVDDDQSIIDAVKTALETRDYNVISASSGEEALEKFEEEEMDIAFLDVKMPGMDGIELLKRVRKESPHTIPIMITAYASVDTAVEAMREGAADYIRKPFELGDIKSTVLGALEDLEFEEQRKTFVSPRGLEWETPLEAFKSWVEGGREGLLISRGRPEELQEKYGLKGNVKQLTISEDGGREGQVQPEKLDELRDKVAEFASTREDSVVLVDDLDYLLGRNSLDSLKEFINDLEEKFSPLDATLIFSGDSENLEEGEMEELEYIISDMPANIISSSLSNQLRRRVISQLSKEGGVSFTTLARRTGIDDSPKMSFHLQKLESNGIIKKDDEGRYSLTERGKNAAEILEEIRTRPTGEPKKMMWVPK